MGTVTRLPLDENGLQAIRQRYKKLVEAGAIATPEECAGQRLTMVEHDDGTIIIEGPPELLNVLRILLESEDRWAPSQG